MKRREGRGGRDKGWDEGSLTELLLCISSVPELKCLREKDLIKIADILQEVCVHCVYVVGNPLPVLWIS